MSFPARLHGGVRIMNRPSPINVRRLDGNAYPMFADMERRGMLIDIDKCRDLDSRMGTEMEAIRREAAETYGGIDISSPDQVYDLMFERLKLPRTGIKWTKSKKRLTVDDDALEMLTIHHDVPKQVQEFRKRAKIKTTYTTPLAELWESSKDRRIRTRFKLTRVVSGRPATEEPNLLNIPIRSDLGKQVRCLFVPSRGRRMISVDQSQIEMRFAAHEACEPNMIEVFRKGLDLHCMTAALMYRMPYEQVIADHKSDKGSEERTAAKSAGFGILYGITAIGLLVYFTSNGALGWTEQKCQELIDKWFAAYPNIRRWLRLQYSRARQHGFNWCMWGRVRFHPEVKSCHENIVGGGDRNAGNFPIQSDAQGSMKLAMAIIWDIVLPKWWARGWDPWPLVQVYDELVFEVEDEIADEFGKDCQEAIENACTIRVPIKCGLKITDDAHPSWGDLK